MQFLINSIFLSVIEICLTCQIFGTHIKGSSVLVYNVIFVLHSFSVIDTSAKKDVPNPHNVS